MSLGFDRTLSAKEGRIQTTHRDFRMPLMSDKEINAYLTARDTLRRVQRLSRAFPSGGESTSRRATSSRRRRADG